MEHLTGFINYSIYFNQYFFLNNIRPSRSSSNFYHHRGGNRNNNNNNPQKMNLWSLIQLFPFLIIILSSFSFSMFNEVIIF